MIRVISIVLILAIALQTVACTTWRQVVQMKEVPEANREVSIREQALEQLKEGMRVRIRIWSGIRTPIKGRVIDCTIEEIGHTTLTVIPFIPYAGGNDRKEYSLRYVDIASVEFRESHDLLPVFVAGTMLGFFAIGLVFLPPWN